MTKNTANKTNAQITNKVVRNDAIVMPPSLNTTSHLISLVSPCKEHLEALAADLREEDRRELWAFYRLPLQQGLALCAAHSVVAWAFFYQGKIAAAGGVAPVSLLGNEACVWLWTGRQVLKCPKAFWKVSKQVLEQFKKLYPKLYAVCDIRYEMAQRYLRHLGAQPTGKRFFLAGDETQFQKYQWQ